MPEALCSRCGAVPVPPGAGAGLCIPCQGEERTLVGNPVSVPAPSRIAGVSDLKLSPEFRARFKVQRLLGVGAMGAVVQAREKEPARTVAIKFLTGELSERALARFRREAAILAALRHPNVILMHEIGEEQGRPYLVIELLEGGSLTGRIPAAGGLAPARAVELMVPCLEALEYCHAKGIIHRDLKPDNILFSAAGAPKIADLGIAFDSDAFRLTLTGAIVGTPRYISPEQATGAPVTPASDVYSMGVIAFHLLAGQPPFTMRDCFSLLRAHASLPPPRLTQVAPGVPSALADAVDAALAKDPADRPASMADLADDLRAALADDGSRTPRRAFRVTANVAHTLPEDVPTTPSGPALPLPPASPSPSPARPSARIAAAALALMAAAVGLAVRGTAERAAPRFVISTPAETSTDSLPETITTTDGSRMLLVPAGFLRGARGAAEPLALRAFYVDRHEVTNAQYAAFEVSTGRAGRTHYAQTSPDLDCPDHPVVGVTFDDALAYCRWAGKELPDEDLWERAARGDDPRLFPWGDVLPRDPPANFRDRSFRRADDQRHGRSPDGFVSLRQEDGFAFTAPVGHYPSGASPFGALDMVGNAAEWCRATRGGGEVAVERGGSWRDNIGVGDARCAGRVVRRPDERAPTVGFRGIRRAR